MAETRQTGRTLVYTSPHTDRRIKVPRFLPQPSRHLYLSRIVLEYRQRADRIGEIERGSALAVAIERERLVVARLGQFNPTRILMDVAQVSNRVC